MSSVGHLRRRSPRDRERQIRMTRTEGARRALRAERAKVVRDDTRSSGRPRDLDQRDDPSRSSVVRFAERIRNLGRSEA
jgi:hypothetical protein